MNRTSNRTHITRFLKAPRLIALTLAGSLGLAPMPSVRADEPMVLEEETAVSDASLEKWFAAGKKALSSERYLAAAYSFNDIVRQGDKSTPIVQEAQYFLAVALYELKLYQSAFTRFEPIIDAGAAHPRYRDTLSYLLKIARATGNDPSTLLRISEYPAEVYPPDTADELNFLVGQFLFGEESLDDALGRFQAVSPRNPSFYVRAKYLEGVIDVSRSGLGTDRPLNADVLLEAADAFKTILRVRRDSGGGSVVERVADDAVLALGRLFYSTRQYDTAVSYYEQVSDDNPHWLDAVYEVSWVHFQLKNYPKALGHLHAVNSPYFASQYYPETRVLQALILFYNCHYDEADAIVKDFVNDYYPLMTQFKAELNQFADPNAFYAWLAKLSRSTNTEYSVRFQRIFDAALRDKRLRRKFELASKLNDEVRRIEKLAAGEADRGLLGRLKGDIESYRSLVIGEAGGLAQARLLRIVKDLQHHLGSALKIKGETLRARRGDISNAAAQEQAAAAAALRDIEVDDEHIEWPFDGEYWKDELGSYLYDVQSECPVTATGEVTP